MKIQAEKDPSPAVTFLHLIGLGEFPVLVVRLLLELLHRPLEGFVLFQLLVQRLEGFLLFFLQTSDLRQQVLVQVELSL